MFVTDLFMALVVAAILTGIFAMGFRKKGPWDSILIFFLVTALGAWAGGSWFQTRGLPVWGLRWFPFLIVGLITALLLAAAMPTVSPDTTVQLVQGKDSEPETRKKLVLGIYFWLLILALAVLIFSRYI